MTRLTAVRGATLVTLLIALPAPTPAGENVAEEIDSLRLCEQAVALDKQREGKLTDPDIVCSVQYQLPPSYWRCVLDTMQRGPDLFSAARSCRQ